MSKVEKFNCWLLLAWISQNDSSIPWYVTGFAYGFAGISFLEAAIEKIEKWSE